MIATIPYIEEKYREFNDLIFEGNLPPVAIQLSRARTFLGMLSSKRKRNWWGKVEHYDFKLKISRYWDLPEREMEDTIIHEMIHYYIAVNKLKDTSSHGKIFRQMMTDINHRFGRNITISYRLSAEQ